MQYENRTHRLYGSAQNIDLLTVKSAPDGTLLVFGRAPHRSASDLPNTVLDNDEVTECIVALPTAALDFSLHQEVIHEFFGGERAGSGSE